MIQPSLLTPRAAPHTAPDTAHRQRPHHRAQGRGFSLVEALFALVVTMVGFSALFSMQKTQMSSSVMARELSAASNIAERVIGQLHKESYMWTSVTLPAPHLDRAPSEWHSWSLVALDHNLQPSLADDPQGTRLSRQRFCVHYWLAPLSGLYDGLMNVRVKVIWPKEVTNTNLVGALCAEGSVERLEEDPYQWLSVTMPALLRRHPL